jgi:hypothetical protein
MVKIVRCVNVECHRQIEVEGHADSSKEVPQPLTCPSCNRPNEIMWPMAGAYSVRTKSYTATWTQKRPVPIESGRAVRLLCP